MVGSIDPRCETVRGIHWPKKGREVVWSSRRGNHMASGPKRPRQQAGHMDASDPIRPGKHSCGTGDDHIWPADQSDRVNRPDIWMQAIRSDPEKTLVARGPSTYGSLRSQGRRKSLARSITAPPA